MTPSFDHFTPLSRAVASFNRDAYAERFAVYDREYKAMLRRLATAQPAPSASEVAREESAFHDAVKRVEFGAEDAPTLVPRDEPVAAIEMASPARLRELVADPRTAPAPAAAAPAEEPWPRPRPRREPTADAPPEAVAVLVEPVEERSRRRPLRRRVGERMAFAVLLLAFLSTALWLGPKPTATKKASASAVTASVAPAAPDTLLPGVGAGPVNNPVSGLPKLQQPSWIAPQMFYTVPPIPTVSSRPPGASAQAAQPPAPAPQAAAPPAAASQAAAPQSAAPQSAPPLPRNEVPLPVPRPDL